MELSFGENLRLLRTRACLTLKDVAQELKVNEATISRWERCETMTGKELPYDTLERLAKLYDRRCLEDLFASEQAT